VAVRESSEFAGRTAIITGAATGIGAGAARGLAAAGANIVLVDLDEDGLEREAGELEGLGARVVGVRADATDTADSTRMVEAALTSFGSVDILVTAAGGHGGAVPTEDLSDEAWEKGIALNLTSTFKSARAVIRPMKDRRYGRIIMISSGSGRMPTMSAPSVSHYAAAKTGILGLARQLAIELGPYEITVNAVAPGTTRTPRVERIRSEESLAKIAGDIPLGRVASVGDQVGPILFLASDAAGYITGATLDVNGGRLMM
jgi:NAD(P)-dependent dehydrogenase (short-subunit alcohol dehydrogenase family)